MPRQSFNSTHSHEYIATRRASAPPPYLLHVPSYDPSTDHFSPEDQLFHERYHDVSKVLDEIVDIAVIRRPSRLARIMPTFESQTSPEQDKQMLEGWRDRLLRELWHAEDFQWDFVDEGNYGRIMEMIGKLREAATSKKLIKSKLKYDHVPGARQPREYRSISPDYSVPKLIAELHFTPRPHPPSYTSPRQSSQFHQPNRSEHSLAQRRRIGYRQDSMRKMRTGGQARDGGLLL